MIYWDRTTSFLVTRVNDLKRTKNALPTKSNDSRFENELRKIPISIPDYYSFGPRKLNVILTELRCSFLL